MSHACLILLLLFCNTVFAENQCTRLARAPWVGGGGGLQDQKLLDRLCGDDNLAPAHCFRMTRRQWTDSGGGVGSEKIAVDLCAGARTDIPQQCFRKARSQWNDNGGGAIGDEEKAATLCNGAASMHIITCFRDARTVIEGGGLGISDENIAINLCLREQKQRLAAPPAAETVKETEPEPAPSIDPNRFD